MSINTAKTLIGFLASLFGKYTFLRFGGKSIDKIYNYLPITNNISTSGQPTTQQFHSIKEAGFQTIINLLPENAENSLKNEANVVAELGMRYISIPVNFKNPTEDNFDEFVSSIQDSNGQKIWVHCAANARVSAFIYRYRKTVLNEEAHIALKDLQKIWKPFGVWKNFISQTNH